MGTVIAIIVGFLAYVTIGIATYRIMCPKKNEYGSSHWDYNQKDGATFFGIIWPITLIITIIYYLSRYTVKPVVNILVIVGNFLGDKVLQLEDYIDARKKRA